MAGKFYYGGQAVVEGVMMRGQKTMVTAVRRPDGGLAMDTQPLPALYHGWLRRTPLVRGIIVLIEALSLGIKSLLYSANVSLEEEGEKLSGGMAWLMVTASLAIGIGLFFIVPLFLTKLFRFESPLVFNLVDGAFRVAMFIAYLKVLSFFPDVRRVFAYHGAEHKTINAYEAGALMEVAAVRKYSTAHTRCGTSFLFAVLIISVVVFSLYGLRAVWQMALSRVILIPAIAALGYESIYFGARHRQSWLVRMLMAPGLWLQSLTTREPDDAQIEIALAALEGAIEADRAEPAPAQVVP